MLLVTGPSGNVGAELVKVLAADPPPDGWRLASRHSPGGWRLASRHPDRPTDIAGDPQLCRFDFFERSTWAAALDGVDVMFLLFPLPGNKAAHEALIPFIHAAQRAGCQHVVYVSVFGADRARFIPHYAVEAALRESSMTWTVLRCSFFMQNLHRSLSTHGVDIVEGGELFIPAGRGRTTFIDARDAAEVAAVALTDYPQHRNEVYHLTGPAALSMSEVAESLSVALGYRVTYTDPSVVRFAARLRRRGVGWDAIGFMAAVYTLTRFGRNQPITDEVERILGRPPRTVEQFLGECSWRWRERAWT